jgi:hypothetical protein
VSASVTPYGVRNAGARSLWCRPCPWRSKPVPAGPGGASFHDSRAVAEVAWRDHHQDHEHQAKGAPADRLIEVGSAPPTIFPEVA